MARSEGISEPPLSPWQEHLCPPSLGSELGCPLRGVLRRPTETAWEWRPLEGELWPASPDTNGPSAAEGALLRGHLVPVSQVDSTGHFFSSKHVKKWQSYEPRRRPAARMLSKPACPPPVFLHCGPGLLWPRPAAELKVHRMTMLQPCA